MVGAAVAYAMDLVYTARGLRCGAPVFGRDGEVVKGDGKRGVFLFFLVFGWIWVD